MTSIFNTNFLNFAKAGEQFIRAQFAPQAGGWLFESQVRQSLTQVVTAPLSNARI